MIRDISQAPEKKATIGIRLKVYYQTAFGISVFILLNSTVDCICSEKLLFTVIVNTEIDI